jgi:NitT/TauT family transport system ATP-binding protein
MEIRRDVQHDARAATRQPGRRAAGGLPRAMNAIQLNGISHRYPNGVQALADVSLSVAPGEFVTLLGPSGCGKSTLLRLLAGLETPSGGQVPAPGDGGVGFVFQSPTLLPWATVRDNVDLPLRLAGRARDLTPPQRRARAEALLQRVGLAGFERAWPDELSGGMQMRVSLARALATDPSLLLLDEPFAALDELTRQQMGEDLLALWRQQGCTVLFVTHNVFEAVYLSQRVIVMSARPGRVHATVPIAAPARRDHAFRRSPAYLEQCVALSATLEAAVTA